MEKDNEFDDIRPYYDEEIPAVIDRLIEDPEFKRVIEDYVFPGGDWHAFVASLKSIENRKNFQLTLVREAVLQFVARSSDSLKSSGFEHLAKETAYTFVSNHRDIVLDAAILAVVLAGEGHDIMEVAIGDNLLLQPWIEDIVRINKSFIVKRGVSFREQLAVSKHLSKYIHYAITKKKESIWIAQREGRAKDSNDRTQESLLKMLAMGSDKPFINNMMELNILPVSLSYEYDPCDYLKAKEFQQKRDIPDFKKSQRDDLLSMETGLFGYKGQIHFRFGRPINTLLSDYESLNKSDQAKLVATTIDKEVFLNYKFYPINYIFYDRLTGEDRFKDYYTEEDILKNDNYLRQQLEKIDLPDKDIPFLTERIYTMYANPVRNYLSVQK